MCLLLQYLIASMWEGELGAKSRRDLRIGWRKLLIVVKFRIMVVNILINDYVFILYYFKKDR